VLNRPTDGINDGGVSLKYPGSIGLIPSAGGVSDKCVSHGGSALIPSCGKGEGVCGEIPKNIYSLVGAGVDM
jgi:hypothetical protein